MSFKDPAFSEFLDTIRSRIAVSDIAASRIKLRRAGREFKACCPFHSEKTPSFTINDHKGFFHCFGCGAHGNVIDFLVRHDNLSFIEAVEQLAKSIGLTVPRRDPQAAETARKTQTVRDCLETATQIFETSLWTSDGALALKTLIERGIDEPAIRAFRLGYAPANRQRLKHLLRERGFEDQQMINAGLIKSYESGKSAAFFSDRILFPIADRLGRPVAFGGRLLRGEGPKYINSPDTELFHKGELLYGLSRAQQAATQGAPLIVVEGYVDVIALVQAGWQGAVAPLGTALTEAQTELLWRMKPDHPPILCFDGDLSGTRAAQRAVDRILPIAGADHRTLRFAFMPEGEDPDSLVRSSGTQRMQAILDTAIPMDEMLWTLEVGHSTPQTPEAEAGLKKRLEARIRDMKDPDLARAYRSALLARFYELVQSTKGKGTPRFKASDTKHRNNLKSGALSARLAAELRALPSGTEQQVMLLFGLIVLHPRLLDEFSERFGALDVSHSDLKSLQNAILSWYESADTLDKAALSAHVKAEGLDSITARLSETCTAQTQCHTWQIDQARLAWQMWHRQLSIHRIEDELRIAETQRWLDSGPQVAHPQISLQGADSDGAHFCVPQHDRGYVPQHDGGYVPQHDGADQLVPSDAQTKVRELRPDALQSGDRRSRDAQLAEAFDRVQTLRAELNRLRNEDAEFGLSLDHDSHV